MNVPGSLKPLKGIISVPFERLLKKKDPMPLSGLFYCEGCDQEFEEETIFVKEKKLFLCKDCRKK